MIKIDSINIQEFRGIRAMDLNLDRKNFGICGPNGTGKSGVVDAIEFCLTGDITRLSGQGSGDLSVAKHGPHVDVIAKPESSQVTIKGHLVDLGKDVTIKRSVAKPRKPVIEPNEPDVIAAFDQLSNHPEFALSRREIAKYVITPPGQRATDVQNLLRLEELDKVRKATTGVAGAAGRKARQAQAEASRARESFGNALGLTKLTAHEILEAINERRQTLGLSKIEELKADTDLLAELPVDEEVEESNEGDQTGVKVEAPVKSVALADLDAFLKSEGGSSASDRADLLAGFEQLAEDTSTFQLIRQRRLVELGLELVEEDSCPLCDVDWQQDELKDHLDAKLVGASQGNEKKEELSGKLIPIVNGLGSLADDLGKIIDYAAYFELELDGALNEFAASLDTAKGSLDASLDNADSLQMAIQTLKEPWLEKSQKFFEIIESVRAALAGLPDASKEETALDELKIAQDRYRSAVQRASELRYAASEAKIAEATRDHLINAVTEILEGIYDDVAEEFSDFYRRLNKDDEDTFTGRLRLEAAKLDLDVDFYGRGHFPPGAFHSEGHQDGMGLCLYLALMKHTLGEEFRFAVLDDVLMSVDAGHRREVCRLLISEFPNTQFILTTHDRVWLWYMGSENLISGHEIFAGWTVDDGPRVWTQLDVWSDIQSKLDNGNVAEAAAALRRYLEHFAFLLSDGLRASVGFRADGNYTLGDLLPPSLSQMKKFMKEARQAAQSWGKADEEQSVAQSLENFEGAVAATDAEKWMINPAVHYNEWENLGAEEFAPVVNAYRSLVSIIQCDTCGSLPYLLYNGNAREQMRCACGSKTFDMKKKPAK